MNASEAVKASSQRSWSRYRSDLLTYQEIDIASLHYLRTDVAWAVKTWFYDLDNLVYDVRISGRNWACNYLVVRQTEKQTPAFDIIDLIAPPKLFHNRRDHIKRVVRDWLCYGWNQNSSLLRALKWSIACLRALEAESLLIESGAKVAPEGMLVIHNTKPGNAESICKNGLSIKFAQSGHGIWTRSPSFGVFDSTYFRGYLSLLLDISGLNLKCSDSHAVVVNEDIALNRIVRIFDLRERRDG